MKYLICSFMFCLAISAGAQNIDWNKADPAADVKVSEQPKKPFQPIAGAEVDEALPAAQKALRDFKEDFPMENLTIGMPLKVFFMGGLEEYTPKADAKDFIEDGDTRIYPIMSNGRIVGDITLRKEENGDWEPSMVGLSGISYKKAQQVMEARSKLTKAPFNSFFLVMYMGRRFIGEFQKSAAGAEELMLTPIFGYGGYDGREVVQPAGKIFEKILQEEKERDLRIQNGQEREAPGGS